MRDKPHSDTQDSVEQHFYMNYVTIKHWQNHGVGWHQTEMNMEMDEYGQTWWQNTLSKTTNVRHRIYNLQTLCFS